MKKIIECPYCDGIARLEKIDRVLTYKKEDFNVVEHFYKCQKCSEEFTTTETDTISILQAHNQYRERHHILFPEEILEIREQYDISATKMSEVLGLGVNGYSNYEKGEIPSLAISNLIELAMNPNMFKEMLEKSKDIFSNNVYEKISKKVDFLIQQKNNSQPFYTKLNLYSDSNSLTGYKRPNKEKIGNLLVSFIRECKDEFNDRLKLNKLLFYTDFLSYKMLGLSMTGLTYRAIDYGPVPTCYDNIYTYFENEGLISSKWIKSKDNTAKETFETESNFDENVFSEIEKKVIEIIINTFKDIPTWDLVEISHKEKSWIDLHSERKVINYQQYAFKVEAV